MEQFILQLGKQSKVCSDIEEAKEFISRFGHLTSAGEKTTCSLVRWCAHHKPGFRMDDAKAYSRTEKLSGAALQNMDKTISN